LDKFNWAKLWVGRGKVVYNDERVTSSGNQQFVNRSIVNDIFTVDRQQGVQVLGNLFPGSWYDMSYAVGVFSGLGVGERNNDDDKMMYAGRLQWNAMGGEMPFSQSDIEFHQKPALNFAFAAATNQSKCTAFETDSRSCRNLPGFDAGKDGQYRINQMMEEVRFKWQGLSIQHEMHWKEIEDTLKAQSDSSRETNLRGGLIQAGYFPHYLFAIVPKNLEFAGRYAFVDPDTGVDDDLQQEVSGVMTYFFSGHSNKVNFQVSHLIVEDPRFSLSQSEQRFWLQWDLSF
jgi:phosphate-selective porin OprO and OprP